jgi:hypothetical protein
MACKSDKKDNEEIANDKEVVLEQTESEKHLQNIIRAHNAGKFTEESQVRFNLKLEVKNKVFFDGTVVLKTDGSKARFLDSAIDQIVEKNNLNNQLDQKLYFLLELYSMGFWLDNENFDKITTENEEFTEARYKSPNTSTTYKIYTHPLTDIVQKIEYKTKLEDQPFDAGTINFEKYITVNRVPVSLKWYFIDDTDTIANADVSRISYPENF